MPLLLLLLFQHAATAPPEPVPSWSNFRAAVNQQSLQTVLISIEERLRALDTLYSPRYTPRWEISIEQQSRRMETIESRLGRLETLLELRLDKLSETMSARQLKEELSKDQINRKLDSTYERLNHRLGYVEARLDVGIAKLQSTIDAGIGRMERLETTTAGRQSDIETELADIGTGINLIKKQFIGFEERHNKSLVAITENGKHMILEMNNMTTLMENLHVEFNKSHTGTELNDEEGSARQEAMQKNINLLIDKVINGIDRHANNFLTKANNMYNDMWRRTQVLEGLVKDSMSLSNATRRELQEGIRTIAVQMGRRGLYQSDRDRQEGSIDIALDTLGLVQRRLNELGRKFDSSFQMLMLAQNLFLESCHRIQLDEPQLETKLTKVLERILDAITNRSTTTDHDVQILQELLKSHSNHMTRTLGQATNTMLQTSEQTNEDSKLLQLSIVTLKEQLLESNKYIEETISDIRDEKAASTERLFNIAAALQELHESVAELSTISMTGKQDGEKYKDEVTECLDSEQIALEILMELQRKHVILTEKPASENATDEANSRETEAESDKDDIFGVEEVFGEEIGEESEQNVEDGDAESIQLKISKPPNTATNEDVTLIEDTQQHSSIKYINSSMNSSSFQRQHRFDLQINKNLSKDIDDNTKSAHVTIQIIPHNINNTPGNDNQDELLGLDLHQFAAIIQNSDMNANQQKPQSTLTIVHESTNANNNNTNVSQQNTNDLETSMQRNINTTLHKELDYINGTFVYNHTEVHNKNFSIANINEAGKSNSSKESSLNSPHASSISSLVLNQVERENLTMTEIKENGIRSNEGNHSLQHVSPNTQKNQTGHNFHDSGTEQHSIENITSLANKTHIAVNNIKDTNSSSPEDVSEVQVPDSHKKLMQLYNQENSSSLTSADLWRSLLAKKQLLQNDTTGNIFTDFKQNNTENTDISRTKHKPSVDLFNANFEVIQNVVPALNDTEVKNYDTQQQQYLTRLQELALDLVIRKDGSETERSFNMTDAITEEGKVQHLNR